MFNLYPCVCMHSSLAAENSAITLLKSWLPYTLPSLYPSQCRGRQLKIRNYKIRKIQLQHYKQSFYGFLGLLRPKASVLGQICSLMGVLANFCPNL